MPQQTRRSIVHGTLQGAERYTDAPAGIVFPINPSYPISVVARSAGFAFLGLALLNEDTSRHQWTGAMGAAFFGYVLVLGVLQLFGPRGGIAILPEGVFVRGLAGTAWVRWEDLDEARIAEWRRGGLTHRYIVFSARARNAIVLTGPETLLQHLNRLWLPSHVAYWDLAFLATPEAIVDAVHHYRWSPSKRAQLTDPATASRIEKLR